MNGEPNPAQALFDLMLAGVGEAPPEAVDHLLNAASELLAAVRVFVDVADQAIDAARAARAAGPSSGLRRVPVD